MRNTASTFETKSGVFTGADVEGSHSSHLEELSAQILGKSGNEQVIRNTPYTC